MKNHSLESPLINTVFQMLLKYVSLRGLLSGALLAAIILVLGACVYKLDIQQGNILEREKVAQIKTGMTKRQVRYILGTPLIIDTFNQDRWDYYYSLKDYSPENRDGTFHQERLTLFFEKGQVSKIDNELAADMAQPAVLDPEKIKGPDATEEGQSETPQQ